MTLITIANMVTNIYFFSYQVRQDLLRRTKLKKLFDKVLFPNMLFVIEATNTIQHIFVFIAAEQTLSTEQLNIV